jgi:predicted  nucleic acid-binding Zn-ribbon protein
MAVTKTIVVNAELKKAQAEFDAFDKSVKETNQSITQLERDLLQLEKQQSKESAGTKKYKELNKQIKATRIRLKEERMDLKELNGERTNAKTKLDNLKKARKDAIKQTGIMNTGIGKMITSMKSFGVALKTQIATLGLFRLALIGTGIGALVVGVISLIQAFKRSEKGQKMLKVLMAGVGAVVNQVLDAFGNLGMGIIDAFTNPIESLKNFASTIKNFIMRRINAMIDTLGFLGKGIQKLFSGDLKGALNEGKKALNTFNKELNPYTQAVDLIGKGIKNVADGIKETTDEVGKAMKAQKMVNDAMILDRELRIERAKATEEVSRLRLDAEKRDQFTAEQRMEMLKQAQQIEEDIANKELKSAQMKLDAQRLEMSLGENSTEALDKEAELEEALIKIQNKKLQMQRLLQTQLTTATNQAIADKKKEVEETKKAEEELANFKQSVREATAVTEEEQFALELEKINEEYQVLKDQALQQFEDEQLTKDELAEIEAQLENARQQKIQDAKNQNAEEGAKKRKDIAEKELNDRLNEMREEEALRQRKLKGASDLINGLQSIAELGGKKSRALAIAGIVTDQVASVSQIISNLGIANAKALAKSPATAGQPFIALNTIKAVAEIGAGLSASKKAISNLKSNTQSPTTSSGVATGGGGGSAPSVSTDVATPSLAQPSLSVAGGGINQLAEALGQTEPVQAFVVANDVTTAQSMERNIVNSAGI